MKKIIALFVGFSLLCLQHYGQDFMHRAGQSGLDFNQARHLENGSSNFYELVQKENRNNIFMQEYDSLHMNFAGNWPLGESYSVTYSGTGEIFFVGSGAGVLIIDASDTDEPEILGQIKARALVDAIWYDAEDDRLYLAAYFSGIEIWDVSNFTAPYRLTRFSVPALPRGGVFEQDGYVFAITVADGIFVYDITDLSNIQNVDWIDVPGSGLVFNSCKMGNYIFCAASASGCSIFDISDPLNVVTEETIPGYATGVWTEGNYAYIVASNFGLSIYDISDISNAVFSGEIQLQGTPNRVTVLDEFAIVAVQTQDHPGIQVVDTYDKTNPELAGAFDAYTRHIAVSGNRLIGTGGTYGINFLTTESFPEPVLMYSYMLPSSTWDVAVDGDYAYSGSNGFRVFDISNKANPEEIGSVEAEGLLVKKSGDIVVLAPRSMGGSNPVSTIDVSDPENPVKRGQYTAPVMTYDMDTKDNYVYIACWWDGFRVLDISDPNNPVLASHAFGWQNSGSVPGVDFCYVQALDTDGDYLYIIDYKPFENEDTKGLYIFNISDPENPELEKRYTELMSGGYDIEVRNGYAYIADKNGGFEVIHVANPQSPYSVAYLSLSDVAYAVDVDEHFAYIANYINGGIQVMDISNPEDPFSIGYYKPSGCFAVNVSVQDEYTYIADGPAGIGIYGNLLITGQQEKRHFANDLIIAPNPFSDVTQITIELNTAEDVEAGVYDISGRFVGRIFEGILPAGTNKISWDGTDQNGKQVSNGVYLVKTRTAKNCQSTGVLLLK